MGRKRKREIGEETVTTTTTAIKPIRKYSRARITRACINQSHPSFLVFRCEEQHQITAQHSRIRNPKSRLSARTNSPSLSTRKNKIVTFVCVCVSYYQYLVLTILFHPTYTKDISSRKEGGRKRSLPSCFSFSLSRRKSLLTYCPS